MRESWRQRPGNGEQIANLMYSKVVEIQTLFRTTCSFLMRLVQRKEGYD